MIELRFVKRAATVPIPGMKDTAEVKKVKILQQRIKTGSYSDWSEWHDVPVVEEEDNE